MREAVRAACDHAYAAMAIRRIEAEVNTANSASCGLLSTLGFRLEGTLRQRWTAKGVTYDTHLYGLLGGVAALGAAQGNLRTAREHQGRTE